MVKKFINFRQRFSDCSNSIMFNTHFKRLVSSDMKKKTGLNGYVYDFSVDYDTMAIDDIYIYI